MCSAGEHVGFPVSIPDISITASPARLGPIDCRELQWWFAVPEVGHRSSSGCYDTDTGALDSIRRVLSTVPVANGAADAVDMEIREDPRAAGTETTTFRFTCALDEDYARWLAVTIARPEGMTAMTQADPHFDGQWGPLGKRRLLDSGRFAPMPDGCYHLTDADGRGAGVYSVTVGHNTFTCLRVIDLPRADESAELVEAFVEPGGRTIMYRQYRGRAMDNDWQQWREAHPGAEIRVDDALFLHRDCLGRAHTHLTDAAFNDALTASLPAGTIVDR